MPRYTIEIAGPHNENALFSPVGSERLRGRWNTSKVAHRNKSGEGGDILNEFSMAGIDLIPGLFISLDTDRREGVILDPLGESPQGKEIQAKIKSVLDRHKDNPLDCGSDPWVRSPYPELGLDGVKEWAFYMRTMLDGKIAEKVPGSADLPPVAEIRKWPGKRRRDPLNTGAQEAESESEMRKGHGLYKFADEVPDGAELVGAAAGEGDAPKGRKPGGQNTT